MTRRTFTALTASALTLTAGCTNQALTSAKDDGNSELRESTTLPYSSDTPEENVDSPRNIRLSNSDDTEHRLALEIEASSNALVNETYNLPVGDAKFIENVAAKKTTYHVSARVNSQQKTYTWKLSESVKDLIIEVNADGQLTIGAATMTGDSSGSTTETAGSNGA